MASTNKSYGRRSRVSMTVPGVRNVAPTFGKVRHLTYSNKCAGNLLVESDAERLTSHMLTLDPRVKQFQSQPFTVDLIDRRILRNDAEISEARKKHSNRAGPIFYTPDFSIDWIALTRSALEVKLEDFEGDATYQNMLQLGASILNAHGYRFSVAVIPRDTRHPYYSSLVLLKQATGRPEQWPDAQQKARATEICSKNAVTLKSLCSELGVSPNLVPAMLVTGCVSAEISAQHISGGMLLSAAYGDLAHLELIDKATA
jgi:hypothetical protein